MTQLRFAELLRQAVVDRNLSREDWDGYVAAAVRALPKRASDEARQLLAVARDRSIAIDSFVGAELTQALGDMGYPAGTLRPLDENITEGSVVFESLARLLGRKPAEQLVGVVDSGIDATHPALAGKVWNNPAEQVNGADDDGNGKPDDIVGWNFGTGDNQLTNLKSNLGEHGTHVFGIATRGTAPVSGIACVIGEGIFDPNVAAPVFSDAIEYALKSGASVINISQVVAGPIGVVVAQAARAHPNVVFTISAGNAGRSYAAGRGEGQTLANLRLPNVVFVAASEPDGSLADFSSRDAPWVGLAARGGGVVSSVPGQPTFTIDEATGAITYQAAEPRFGQSNGTSMAAPWAANVIAKCRSLNSSLTAEQVIRLVSVTSDRRPDWKGAVTAGGPINESRALQLAALLDLQQTPRFDPDLVARHMVGSTEQRKKLVEAYAMYLSTEVG